MDRPARILAVGFAGLLLAAGCSSGSSGSPASGTQGSPSSAASGATTSIKVGTAPTLSGTSFYLAAQNRTFVKDHLSAAPELMTSGGSSSAFRTPSQPSKPSRRVFHSRSSPRGPSFRRTPGRTTRDYSSAGA